MSLTCWKTECTSCRTEVFTFMHQRILIQHLANYCRVVSIHGLIVIVSCRNSEQDMDKNQSVTDLIIPNKKLTLLTRKELYDSTEIVPNGFYIDTGLSYVFVFVLASWGDFGNRVSQLIMVQLLGTKSKINKARNERKSKPKFKIRK